MTVRNITIRDVAKKAKASVGTVSRVLNNNAHVSDRIRDKVLKVIEDLNYSPDNNARMLARAGKSRTTKKQCIGIVLEEGIENRFSNQIFAPIFEGAIRETSEFEYRIIPDYIKNNYRRTVDLPGIIQTESVDGVIAIARISQLFIEQMVEMDIPIVLVGAYYKKPLNSIIADEYQGAFDAVKHLIDSGHKKIGLISSQDLDFQTFKLRFDAYKDALLSSGIEYNESLVEKTWMATEGGYRAMQNILGKGNIPTGIFVMNDYTAIGAKRAIEKSGMKVPDDISIIGFDDIQLASEIRPALTTMKVDTFEVGKLAARKMYDLIEGRITVPTKTVMPVSLIERESVKKIH